MYGLKSKTQLENWVEKYRETPNPLNGKKIHFKCVEEERDYYKVQVEYLKKR
ncbi:hypothetical protein [Bacillus sp. TH50]|uniref:hypothetical protein n=1 Tax=Bacillus sp. TH50 TaxID=2796414 RepID=UPI001F5BA7A8|nr:hypothetical protein [Bacillus sp. TH50]